MPLAAFFIGRLLQLISAHRETYAVVFVVSAVDAFFPVVQSETVVILAAIAAAGGRLSVTGIGACAAAGAFVGDNVTYWGGRKLGTRAVRRWLSSERWERRLQRATALVHARGGNLILTARFVPLGRTLTTFAAGALDMRWVTFAGFDAAAATAWAAMATLLGYLGGQSFESSPWKALAIGLGVALVVSLAGEAYWRAIERRNGGRRDARR